MRVYSVRERLSSSRSKREIRVSWNFKLRGEFVFARERGSGRHGNGSKDLRKENLCRKRGTDAGGSAGAGDGTGRNAASAADRCARSAFGEKIGVGNAGIVPGRVVEVADAHAIAGNRVSQPVVHEMLERGLKELTGENSTTAAFAKFVEPKDVVGIKINPSGAPACCSSPELVREIIEGVRSAECRCGTSWFTTASATKSIWEVIRR